MGFKVGQLITLEIDVRFYVEFLNELRIEEVLVYPKGEVVEILDVNDDGTYKLKFYTDEYATLNDKKITFSFDERTIKTWSK